MKNMKAAIYSGKESIEIRDLPTPVCGDNDVLIKNIYSSICKADVAVFRNGPGTGHRIDIGGEFGHETISRVAAVGRNVTEFRVGDRVYPYPLYAKGDTRRAGTIGGFSEYILIPDARLNHSLYRVDERISDRLACLTEPFTVGCRAARRSAPKQGERVRILSAFSKYPSRVTAPFMPMAERKRGRIFPGTGAVFGRCFLRRR